VSVKNLQLFPNGHESTKMKEQPPARLVVVYCVQGQLLPFFTDCAILIPKSFCEGENRMLRCAIVEDSPRELEHLKECLARYSAERDIPLDDKAFRYWNVKTDRWETEGGSYQLLVGASVQDIRLRAEVPVQGTGAPDPYVGKAVQCYRTADIKNVPDAAFEALLGHAIPEDKPHIDQTMTLGELNHSRSPLCWLAWAVLHTLLKRSSREGTPDLNLLFQYNMPVRALAQMTGGMVGQETVDGIVMEAKGFWIIGLLRALIGFGQNAVSNRKFRAALDAERGGPAV
jgi:hypothetical protein